MIDTEDDKKPTITTGGRKDKGIGNEVKAPSGQEDPIKQNMDEDSEPKQEKITEEAAVKKNNTEGKDDDTEDDGTTDGSLNTTRIEVKAPGGQEDPTKQDMEYEKSETEEEEVTDEEAVKKNKNEEDDKT